MTCGDVNELLAAHADGGLEGDERDHVAAHVNGCAACAAEVRELRELIAAARRAAPREDKGEAFWDAMARDVLAAVAAAPVARRRRWPLFAAAGGLAAAAATILYLSLGQGPRPHPAPATTASVLEEVDDEELAVGSLGEAEDDIEELDDAALERATEAL